MQHCSTRTHGPCTFRRRADSSSLENISKSPPPLPSRPPPHPLASNQCKHADRGLPSLHRAKARLNAGRDSPGRIRRQERSKRHASAPRPAAMRSTARLLKAATRATRRSRSSRDASSDEEKSALEVAWTPWTPTPAVVAVGLLVETNAVE